MPRSTGGTSSGGWCSGEVARRMRVGLDATPLLGPRTGVGQYVARLVEALAVTGEVAELRLVPFTWRGAAALPGTVAAAGSAARAGAGGSPRLRVGRRRVPARLLREAWARAAWPPVEWLSGRVEVFHGTNFVAPP